MKYNAVNNKTYKIVKDKLEGAFKFEEIYILTANNDY